MSSLLWLLCLSLCVLYSHSPTPTLAANASNASNATNSTVITYRDYEVKIFVSRVFFSGSNDPLYFQLCSNNYAACTGYYVIENGLPNTGEVYDFKFNTIDIGDINHAVMVANGTDGFCLARFGVNGVVAVDTIPDCLDTSGNGECEVINITLGSETFNRYTLDPCTVELSPLYIPPVYLPNGTRKYDLSFTVSNLPFSGSSGDLWFRLCNRGDYQKILINDANCTAWDVLGVKLDEEGDTYPMDYIPPDVGDIRVLQMTTFSTDRVCIGSVTVDAVTEPFSAANPGCIDNTGESDSCDTLWVVLDAGTGSDFDTNQFAVCPYAILSNATIVKVSEYKIEFEVSAIPGFGTDDHIYFLFETRDGARSTVYRIAHVLEYGNTYKFTVDITDETAFDSLADIYLMYLFTIAGDKFCLSSFNINRVWSDDFLPPECVEYGGVAADGGCDVLQINIATGAHTTFENGTCGFLYTEAKSIGSKQSETWYEWTQNNWEIVAGSILGLVAICVMVCWLSFYCAKKRKSHTAGAEADGPAYGGNSYFQ